jgi:ArsR family transcriptional regulator, arsenate/arsenite/antimonite-responsive transcriptional repressor
MISKGFKYTCGKHQHMPSKPINDLRVKIFNALGDPTRLELLEHLADGEKCVYEILPAFDRSQSTISKHLNILYAAGLVDRRIDGKRTLYKIKDTRIFDVITDTDILAMGQVSRMAEEGKDDVGLLLKSYVATSK